MSAPIKRINEHFCVCESDLTKKYEAEIVSAIQIYTGEVELIELRTNVEMENRARKWGDCGAYTLPQGVRR